MAIVTPSISSTQCIDKILKLKKPKTLNVFGDVNLNQKNSTKNYFNALLNSPK
jgi:hypothetical protein